MRRGAHENDGVLNYSAARSILAGTFMTIVLAVAPGSAYAAEAVAAGPAGLAFYNPPAPLPSGVHGDVIWARRATGAAALPAAARNLLLLYHTMSATGGDVAVSGSLAIPSGDPPAGGWPIVSWAHGTTGNAPACAPTRGDRRNDEQASLDAWVTHGYAVVQTDYEGQGTPGLHPYFVGVAAAHDVTDIVRAARRIEPRIGTRWFALGHSEGGSAAIFTAALGPSWAPELHLAGAVAYAPASHIASFLQSVPRITQRQRALPLILAMIEGIASTDPAIRLDELLSSQALAKLPDLRRRCTGDLMSDDAWLSVPSSEIFRREADIRPLLADFVRNEDDRVTPAVPLLLVQGAADTMVSLAETNALERELCSRTARITYEVLARKTHDSVVTDSFPQVQPWIASLGAGDPPGSCDTPAAPVR